MIKYLRYLYILVCTVFACTAVTAQNMVPNGDFELYNTCPNALTPPWSGGIDFSPTYSSFPTVQNWVRTVDAATPDYFNACAPVGNNVAVPHNLFGYQQPHSGNGYAGFYPFSTTDSSGYPRYNYREILTVKLTAPMIKDSTYCASFYVSPTAKMSFAANLIAVNEVGANFSDTMPYSSVGYSLALPYHIMNDTTRHLDDTTKWYKVSGYYVAKGGEEWMTVGTFRQSVFPAYSVIPPNVYNTAAGGWIGYFYLDDVSVYQVTSPKAVHDTTFCSTGSLNLQLSSSTTAAGYTWSNGDTTQTTTIQASGTYWVIAHSDCTIFTDTFHINYTQLSPPVVHDTTICQSVVDPRINVTGSNLLWYTSSTATTGTATQPAISTSAAGTVTIYVAATSGNCISSRVPVNINITAKPVGHALQEITHCTDEVKTITIGESATGMNYTWSTGESLCCIEPEQDGVYIRTAYNNCGSVQDTTVLHSARCEDCMYFPTAFSPNDDTHNDFFRPIVLCPIASYTLNIFDRWGECIFTGNTVTEKWDGRYNGELMPLGTYYYLATYTHAATGKKFMLKGDVALIR